jgi:hypothetical protein
MTTEFVLKEMDGEFWVPALYWRKTSDVSYDAGKLVGRVDEREACAVLVEQMGIDGYGTLAIAAAIRARGQT